MASFLDLEYQQSYSTLNSCLYSPVYPSGLSNPKLVVASDSVCDLIGVDTDCLSESDTLQMLSGNSILDSWQPLAMKYTGHQFGHYNPDLGDGRGLLLTEVKHRGKIWDLHLKGSGPTPYSRQGDGRAVLRSSIREFLASEAMHGLGIPTTRALCVVDSDTPVYREQEETGATLMRVAKTHIRFGHFEYLSFSQKHEELKLLCDYVINRFHPELNEIEDYAKRIHGFFHKTLISTCELIALWQSVGFNHGVMNTDNMSILGDTFDYGPYAFLDDYDQHFICNHSDHQGRYAFDQQPNIANWNLAILAQALLPLANKQDLIDILEQFPALFKRTFLSRMVSKLGLHHCNQEQQEKIVNKTMAMLHQCRLDYTLFFRQLCDFDHDDVRNVFRDHALDIQAFDLWWQYYQSVLVELTDSQKCDRKKTMLSCNPKFILRNYLAQEAIDAANAGDYSYVQTLHGVLKYPFDEHPDYDHLAKSPPEWGKHLSISCSS